MENFEKTTFNFFFLLFFFTFYFLPNLLSLNYAYSLQPEAFTPGNVTIFNRRELLKIFVGKAFVSGQESFANYLYSNTPILFRYIKILINLLFHLLVSSSYQRDSEICVYNKVILL